MNTHQEYLTKNIDISNKFTKHLFQKYDNIRFHKFDFTNANKDEICYFITNKMICFPSFIVRTEHEISHMVEMHNYARLTKMDWGMKMSYLLYFDNPASIYKISKIKTFFKAMAREIRTSAIENIITNFASEKDRINSSTYNIFNNPSYPKMVKKVVPFCTLKSEQDVEAWAFDIRDKTFNKWSKDRVEHEWIKRMDYIQNYVNSNSNLEKVFVIPYSKSFLRDNKI